MILDLTWNRYDFPNFPEVSMELRPLTFKGYQSVMGLMAEMGEGEGAAKNFSKIDFGATIEEIFPEHIRDIRGIQVKVSSDETRDALASDITSSGAFAAIAIEILAKLMEISQLGKEDEKKSGALPGG